MRIASLLLLLALPALAGGADDAKALLAKGDAAKAVEVARKATKADPSDIAAWLVLADARVAQDSPEDACGDLEAAIAKNKEEPRLWLKLGDINIKIAEKLQNSGSSDGMTIANYYLDAERCYGEALKRDEKSAQAVFGMANANYWSGRPDGIEKAKKLLSDCLALDKDFARAHALQAYMLYREGMELANQRKQDDAMPKFQAAETAYATALKLGDKDPIDMVRYGHTLLAQDRLDEAKAAYLEALKAGPMSKTPIESGLYHVANRRAKTPSWANPNLKPLLQEAAKEVPQSPLAWFYLAYCQTLESDWDAALDSYKKARDLDPKNATYVYQVGYMHERKGDGEKALDAYREALKMAPSYPEVALRFQGIILAEAQDIDRAEKLWDELIKLAPENVDVHNNYALVLRDWAEATRRATDKDPPAEVKRRIKRSGEVYEIAASLSNDPQIQSDTGLLFEYYPCNFDAEKAKRYFTKALQESDYAYRDAFDGLDRLCKRTGDWATLADYAERVVGSMERGNNAIAPAGGGPAKAMPNESPGLKARAEASLRLAQDKLKKS
ncbi:MAG TPA: tetratricopeptide repeat protein [Planctomycetota bacterium]|nr:tetratricopeptide repeat protein [Planctomycetota bacterium]